MFEEKIILKCETKNRNQYTIFKTHSILMLCKPNVKHNSSRKKVVIKTVVRRESQIQAVRNC